jgi:hypothetical protein
MEDHAGTTRKRCAKKGSHLVPKAIPDVEGFKFFVLVERGR